MAEEGKNKVAVSIDEGSLFLKVLGGKDPTLKIIDFLIDNLAFDYSKTDIAEGAEISRTTLFSVWDNIEANELVVFTRDVGRAKMYKLNMKNQVVKKLIELDRAISDYYAPQLVDGSAIIIEDVPEERSGIPMCLI